MLELELCRSVVAEEIYQSHLNAETQTESDWQHLTSKLRTGASHVSTVLTVLVLSIDWKHQLPPCLSLTVGEVLHSSTLTHTEYTTSHQDRTLFSGSWWTPPCWSCPWGWSPRGRRWCGAPCWWCGPAPVTTVTVCHCWCLVSPVLSPRVAPSYWSCGGGVMAGRV